MKKPQIITIDNLSKQLKNDIELSSNNFAISTFIESQKTEKVLETQVKKEELITDAITKNNNVLLFSNDESGNTVSSVNSLEELDFWITNNKVKWIM